MKTYNDYVRHYLETDRNPMIPQVVDKLGLKEYATSKGVATPKTLPEVTDNCVVKATNDSGGTMIIRNGETIKGSWDLVNKYKDTPYGVHKGEWFYGPIPHRVFVEEYLTDNITDYKFHCHKGKVMFCQTIFDRNTGSTKECIMMPDRTYLDYRLDYNFAFSTDIEFPENWDDLVAAAQALCEDWNYVRVDLYTVDNTVYVGELTFAPRAGRYTGEGQELLGKYF